MSHLSYDTSIEDIKCFVKSKVMEPFGLGCYKLKPSLDSRNSSFKLYVADDKFSEIVNPPFWPRGLIVWEFVFRPGRRRNGVNLPGPTSQKTSSNFKIVYRNVRGLKSKLSSLYNSRFDFEFDGIAFTET